MVEHFKTFLKAVLDESDLNILNRILKIMAFENSTRFTIGLVFLLLLIIQFSAAKSVIFANPLSKHSFQEVSKCDGEYDMSIYSIMNQICQDCYNEYRDPGVYRLCRKDCFTTRFFEGCLDVIGRTEEKEKLAKSLSVIHRQLEIRQDATIPVVTHRNDNNELNTLNSNQTVFLHLKEGLRIMSLTVHI